VIFGRTTTLGASLNKKGLEERPLGIGNPPSNQLRLLSRGSLESSEDSLVNHFVNTP